MATNAGNRGADRERPRALRDTEAGKHSTSCEAPKTEVVFDFTDVQHPDFADLSLVLTARLLAGPRDRVWVRALPLHTWYILSALGLDHLFRDLPGPTSDLN